MSADAPLNGDLRQRVWVDTSAMDWTPSPSGQVERKRVHRVGPAESGQVTSVVRYLPGASFPEHDHPEGEEIFVLEGVFSDQLGDATEGMHLLNPEGFRHAPFSKEGCVIFVKLRQYDGEGRPYRRVSTNELPWTATDREGVEEKVLFEEPAFADRTSLERWASGARPEPMALPGGAEIYVIAGQVIEGDRRFGAGSFLRWPAGGKLELGAIEETTLYVKTGAVAGLRSA